MKCKFCNGFMEIVDRYNPPYPEPKEVLYKCEDCGAKANDCEAYGVEWYCEAK